MKDNWKTTYKFTGFHIKAILILSGTPQAFMKRTPNYGMSQTHSRPLISDFKFFWLELVSWNLEEQNAELCVQMDVTFRFRTSNYHLSGIYFVLGAFQKKNDITALLRQNSHIMKFTLLKCFFLVYSGGAHHYEQN